MQVTVSSYRYHTLDELMTALQACVEEAGVHPSTMYVSTSSDEDADSTVRLIRRTLSDGSIVYDVNIAE